MNKIILGGFLGGATVSLLELMAAINAKEYGMVSLFFLLGLIVSGVIGIIGVLIMSPKDIKHAVTTGIAAPSILAGLVKSKVVAATAVAVFYVVSPPVYAGDTDGTAVEIKVEKPKPKPKPKPMDQFIRGVFGL
jgi:hypothetical protein